MSELKTCFKRVDYDLAGLLHYLDIGGPPVPEAAASAIISIACSRCAGGITNRSSNVQSDVKR